MPRGSQTRHASVVADAARGASTDTNHHSQPHPASASSATAGGGGGGGGGGVDDDEEEPLLLLRSATAASTLSALREPALPAHEPLLVQMRKTHVGDKVGMAYEGTTVTRVTPGQLADTSGVCPGMLILSVNGVRVRCAAEVRVAVAAATDVDLLVRAPASDASPEEAAAARLDTAAEARAAAAQAAEAKASARRAGLRRGVFVPDAACLAVPGGPAFQPAYCHPPRFDRARLVLPAVLAGAFEVCFVVMQLVFYGNDDTSFVASSHALKVLSVAALWALGRRSWRLHTEKVAAEALRAARGAAAGTPPPASGCSGAEAATAAAWAVAVPGVLCYSAAADYGACQDADGADDRVFAANATSSLLAASRQPGRDVGEPVACPPLVLLGLHAATLLCVCVACLRAAHVVLARLAPAVHVREAEVPAFVVTTAAAAAAVAPVTRGLSLTAVPRRSTHSLHRGDSGGTTHVSDLVVVDLDDEPEAAEDGESGSGSEGKREEENNSEGGGGSEGAVSMVAAAQSQQDTLVAVLVAGAVSAVAALRSPTPTPPPQPQPMPVPQQPQVAEESDASGRWRKRGKQAGVGHRWQQMAVPAPSPTSFLKSAERKFQRQLPQQQQQQQQQQQRYAGGGGYPSRLFPPGRTSPAGLACGFAPPQGHHSPFPPDPYGYEQGGPLPYGGGVPVPLAPLSPLRPFRYSEYSGDGYGYGGRPDYYGSDEGAEEASERRVWALREYEAASLHVATDAASGISGVIRLMEARRRVLGCRR